MHCSRTGPCRGSQCTGLLQTGSQLPSDRWSRQALEGGHNARLDVHEKKANCVSMVMIWDKPELT